MLSRFPISLAQLKAGNDSEKLIQLLYTTYTTIRQLLYSLYRSQKLSKTIDQCYLRMETISMNTLNSKTN